MRLLFILTKIQRMVGMSLFRNGAGTVPVRAILLSHCHHIPDAAGKVLPLLDDRAPCRPYRRLLRDGQDIAEGLQIFLVEDQIARPLHGIGVGRPLGVNIEHYEAVVAIAKGDPLHGLERVVQIVRLGGRRIDADANKRIFAPGTQNIAVF